MKTHYCLDISFPSFEPEKFMVRGQTAETIHHAHLNCDGKEIEIRIFYTSNTYYGDKLSAWVSKINWNDFGSLIKVDKCDENARVKEIVFGGARLLGITNSTDQFESGKQYVKVLVDKVKFYWEPIEEYVNTAEFYMNDAGFQVVQDFYSVLFEQDGSFDISRMNGFESYYTFGKAEFRPEFNFWTHDNKKEKVASITKEPKFQFRYKEDITEDEALKYAEVIRLITSFYHHAHIDFIMSKIHLKNHTITIKKILKNEKHDRLGNLWAFKYNYNFDYFLKSEWQAAAEKNFKKISKVVEMFNQALLVDSSSTFLIRYNIIEICMGGTKLNEDKFTTIVDSDVFDQKYKNALTILLETVSTDQHEDFIKKWKGVSKKLIYKPMISPLLIFLESQGFTASEFPISVEKLKEIRDNITHGSLERVDSNDLRKANIILYRINGILILNLIGIKDWKFDTQLPA